MSSLRFAGLDTASKQVHLSDILVLTNNTPVDYEKTKVLQFKSKDEEGFFGERNFRLYESNFTRTLSRELEFKNNTDVSRYKLVTEKSVVFRNGYFVTFNSPKKDFDLAVRDGFVFEVKTQEIPEDIDPTVLDVNNTYLLPEYVNAWLFNNLELSSKLAKFLDKMDVEGVEDFTFGEEFFIPVPSLEVQKVLINRHQRALERYFEFVEEMTARRYEISRFFEPELRDLAKLLTEFSLDVLPEDYDANDDAFVNYYKRLNKTQFVLLTLAPQERFKVFELANLKNEFKKFVRVKNLDARASSRELLRECSLVASKSVGGSHE